jgi:hypothetical protein
VNFIEERFVLEKDCQNFRFLSANIFPFIINRFLLSTAHTAFLFPCNSIYNYLRSSINLHFVMYLPISVNGSSIHVCTTTKNGGIEKRQKGVLMKVGELLRIFLYKSIRHTDECLSSLPYQKHQVRAVVVVNKLDCIVTLGE